MINWVATSETPELAGDRLGADGGAGRRPLRYSGPEPRGYYFAFRVVGHYLSFRGASRGLTGIAWQQESTAPLTELRRCWGSTRSSENARPRGGGTLRLEHLVTFFERTAVST